jgi:hypothetical protein
MTKTLETVETQEQIPDSTSVVIIGGGIACNSTLILQLIKFQLLIFLPINKRLNNL